MLKNDLVRLLEIPHVMCQLSYFGIAGA